MFNDDFSEYRVNCLPWTVYAQALRRNPVLFLPVGALEQHGPHLPMACDAVFADAMAVRAAQQMNGLVLPVLTYGYKSQARSGGGQQFPGTTSLDGQTLTAMVQDVLREVFRHGVTRVVVLNGHVENQWFITEGIDLALREALPANPDLRVLRCEYWNYTPQSTLDAVFDGPFPGVDLEHAALLETSMMLALHPQLVRMDELPADDTGDFAGHDRYPPTGNGVPDSGVLAPASGASAEKGTLLINTTVEAMVKGLRKDLE